MVVITQRSGANDQNELFRLASQPDRLAKRVRVLEKKIPPEVRENLQGKIGGRWNEFLVAGLNPLIQAAGLRRSSTAEWRAYSDSVDAVESDGIWHYTKNILSPVVGWERGHDRTKGASTIITEVSSGLHESLSHVPAEYQNAWFMRVVPEACHMSFPGAKRPILTTLQNNWINAAKDFSMLMCEVTDLPGEARLGFAGDVVPGLIKAGLIDSDLAFKGHGRGSTKVLVGHQKGFSDIVGQLPDDAGQVQIREYTRELGKFIGCGGFWKHRRLMYQWERLHELQGLLPRDEIIPCMGGPMQRIAEAGRLKTPAGWDEVIAAVRGKPGGSRAGRLTELASE